MTAAFKIVTQPALPAGISVRDATVTYRNGQTAMRDASFEVPTGTITALVGVNGSGKSTLFKAIMGFVRLARGSIQVLGMPVAEALRRNLVAYVPQAEEVDWNFPVLVEDVVMMGRYGHMNMMRIPKAADREAVSAALASARSANCRAGRRSASSWPARWRRTGVSSCSTSRSPASTSRPRTPSSTCCARCATRGASCWCRRTISAACRSSATAPCS
jgi:ATPase subunit of ABC transporter with duplicated ATPase domains